ncbi:hypothetical protein FOZ61_007806 [Perkinsus olseni]|uniref:Uncharacterized protein n=1 Tax=Perkinsus olseni TaxID=32597 RepID=A0A7J6M848_PEROL|nr:hypothetical protein FOZ61_007806 [Perkinsus olseni]KAF4673522.1 hypothetical protein FOL46_007012 [Perkinsus olseni]
MTSDRPYFSREWSDPWVEIENDSLQCRESIGFGFSIWGVALGSWGVRSTERSGKFRYSVEVHPSPEARSGAIAGFAAVPHSTTNATSCILCIDYRTGRLGKSSNTDPLIVLWSKPSGGVRTHDPTTISAELSLKDSKVWFEGLDNPQAIPIPTWQLTKNCIWVPFVALRDCRVSKLDAKSIPPFEVGSTSLGSPRTVYCTCGPPLSGKSFQLNKTIAADKITGVVLNLSERAILNRACLDKDAKNPNAGKSEKVAFDEIMLAYEPPLSNWRRHHAVFVWKQLQKMSKRWPLCNSVLLDSCHLLESYRSWLRNSVVPKTVTIQYTVVLPDSVRTLHERAGAASRLRQLVACAEGSTISLPVEARGVKVVHTTLGGREVSQRVFDEWMKDAQQPETKRSRVRDSDGGVEDPADLSLLNGQCASQEIDVPCYDECWPRAHSVEDEKPPESDELLIAGTAGADTIYGMLDELDDF